MSDVNVKTTLVSELKKEGIDLAEDAVAGFFKALVRVGQTWLMNHPNTYVKMLAPVLMMVEKPILAEIDKMDGEDDANR